MKIEESPIPGLLIIEPRFFMDSRGYFFESYNHRDLARVGITDPFVQDNQSLSTYGVIRGLHYQLHPNSQSKLIRVLEGSVWDVAVDLRRNSPTFGKSFGIEISSENRLQLLIPKGLAHGFAVTSEKAVFFYKCDTFYSPADERGIRYDDPELDIAWPVPADKTVISDKDRNLPDFMHAEMNFIFG
jgi:dTDP-4-dehydrorhamnose 3,5-epimerase